MNWRRLGVGPLSYNMEADNLSLERMATDEG